jgi:hypothetical protein
MRLTPQLHTVFCLCDETLTVEGDVRIVIETKSGDGAT